MYLDVETTGLDSKLHDIVEIAVLVEIDYEIVEEKCWTVQPFSYSNVSPDALRLTGKTVELLKTYPDPHQVYVEFIEFLSKYCSRYDRSDKFAIAGYNVAFDTRFLREWFLKNGDSYYNSWFSNRDIDVMSLVYFLRYKGQLTLPNYKLATVALSYNLDIQAHSSLSDVKAVRELLLKFSNLFGGKQ